MVDIQNTAVANYARQQALDNAELDDDGNPINQPTGLPVLQNEIDAICLACVGDTCKKVEEMLAIMESTNDSRVEDKAYECADRLSA